MDKQDRIVKAAEKLSIAERKNIAMRLISGIERESGTLDATVRFHQLVPLAEKALDVQYSPLPMSRRHEDVMVRMFCAAQMVDEGYSRAQIGRAMLRDHSSVTGLIRSIEALRDGFYGPKAAMQYKDFQELTTI